MNTVVSTISSGNETADSTPSRQSPQRRSHALTHSIQRYLDHLVLVAGRSANTLAAYQRDLKRYEQFCTARGVSHPREIESIMIGEFVGGLTDDGLSGASVARALSAVKSFHRHLVVQDICRDNPARALRTPRLPRHLPDVISVRHMRTLLNSPPESDPQAERDRAILAVLYGCGLRVSEVSSLLVENVDFDESYLKVRGKGDRERLIPFGSMTRQPLRLYLQGTRIRSEENRDADHVFLSRRGNHLTRMGIWFVVRKASMRAGIAERVTPHTFRHSFATHLIEAGADLRSVQMMLGHRSVATTQIYTHLDRSHLRRIHSRYHPLEAFANPRKDQGSQPPK